MVVRLSPTQTQQAALIAFVSDAWNNGIYICIYIYIYVYIYIYILNVYMNQIMKEAGKAEFSSYSARICYQVFAQRLPESFA